MVASAPIAPPREETSGSRLSTKLAALVGASGAALSAEAMAGNLNPAYNPYTPTAGVVAAQGIPGFSFTSPTNITLGALRGMPYPLSLGVDWDIDGNVDNAPEFQIQGANTGVSVSCLIQGFRSAAVVSGSSGLFSLPVGQSIPSTASFDRRAFFTFSGNIYGNFTQNVPGYFGFRFTQNLDFSQFYYGWGQITYDLASPGNAIVIQQAYYQSTPNMPIQVGQVPGGSPVPELPANTSALSLLAFGAAGLETLRNRKKQAATVA